LNVTNKTKIANELVLPIIKLFKIQINVS